MKSIIEFYDSIPPIRAWMEINKDAAYRPIPDSWWVLSTDIKGSTRAINEGRYKDVNIVGVCAIVAVQNALKTDRFPFVFGGDGATLLVPQNALEQALAALSYTRKVAKNSFNLEMRISKIPINFIRDQGKTVEVAILQNEEKQNVFLFRGGGLTLAEQLMKNEPLYDLPENFRTEGSHEGLECRWNPIPTSKGTILSLIILPQSEESVIEKFLTKFNGLIQGSQPIKAKTIPVVWPPKDLAKEIEAKEQGFLKKLGVLLYLLLLFPLIVLGRKKAGSAVDKYLHQLQMNTDFVKRDDALRMVLDVTAEERTEILSYLSSLAAEKRIVFGHSESQQALMTCMVKSPIDHFHFVDGQDGGYVRAAEVLKNNLKLKY
ncbi:MAG: DUF3095 family protein [Bdellovibrionales bacterium]